MFKRPFLVWLFWADFYQLSQASFWQKNVNSSALKCRESQESCEKNKRSRAKIKWNRTEEGNHLKGWPGDFPSLCMFMCIFLLSAVQISRCEAERMHSVGLNAELSMMALWSNAVGDFCGLVTPLRAWLLTGRTVPVELALGQAFLAMHTRAVQIVTYWYLIFHFIALKLQIF